MKTTCCVLLVVACGNLEKTHRWPYLGLETNGASMGEGWNKGYGGVFVRSCGKRWSWFVTLCATGLLSCPGSWYYIVVQGKRSVSPTKQVMMAKWSLLLGKGRTHGFPVCDFQVMVSRYHFSAAKDMPAANLKKFINSNIPTWHDSFPSSLLTPPKINMEPKMKVWKMIFLFKWVIFKFHVSFLGCNPSFLFTFLKTPKNSWGPHFIVGQVEDVLAKDVEVKGSKPQRFHHFYWHLDLYIHRIEHAIYTCMNCWCLW